MSVDPPPQMSAEMLQLFEQTDDIIARRYPALRSLVMMRDGKIVCARRYGNGGRRVHPQFPIAPVKSVTKSIMALLIGMLIERRLIGGVNQPLHELLVHRAGYLRSNTKAAEITLHQLLSMTSGFLWRGGRAGMEPLAGRMLASGDWLEFILSLPVKDTDVGKFTYNSAVSHLLSVIVEEATGCTSAEFAQQYLFDPLGIEDFSWEAAPDGCSVGGWGLSMSVFAMARIGQLCIDQGSYQGRSLVPAEWIERMWTAVCEVDSDHGRNQPDGFEIARYGYQWWIRGNVDIQFYCAEGAGGQMIICLPEQRAVIVTSCDYKRRGMSLWPLIEHYWLPALLQL